MRTIKKISCALAVFLVIFTLNANLDRIAGTYTCFSRPDDAELFSPIHGAIAWETGTIRRIYDFGPMFDVEQAREQFLHEQKQAEARDEQKDPDAKQPAPQPQDMQKFLHKQLEAKLEKVETPAVVQLVHLIFYRQVLDSVNPADFVVTKKLEGLGSLIIAGLVGHLLISIKKIELVQKSLRIQASSEDASKQAPLITLKKFLQELSSPEEPIPSNIEEKNIPKEISSRLMQNFKKDAKNDAMTKNFTFSKHHTSLIKDLFTYSIRAFLFPRAFPAETVRLVLLALLYQTSNLAPDVLATYYQTLERLDKIQIKKQVKKQAEDEKEPIQTFTAQYLPLFSENIKKINDPESFKQQYEQATYALLYPRFQVAPYATANLLKQNCLATGLKFPDCMDNAFRNLFNLLAFTDDDQFLTIANLQKISPNLNHNLNKFYTNPIPLTQIALPEDHNRWTQVISNLPYVSYFQKSDSPVRVLRPGYIKIPIADLAGPNNQLKESLTQQGYVIIPFEQGKEEVIITYEIHTSLRNFIIVLNTLLNLNIFKASLAEEFIKPDFVATYLPDILQKIGQKDVSYTDANHSNIDLKNIDALDFKGDSITITTKMFSISVTSGHGEFNIPYVAKKQAFPPIDINKPTLPFSCILLPQNVAIIAALQDVSKRYLALFSGPLENPDFITYIPAEILNDKSTLIFFLYLATRHPDPIQRQISLCRIYERHISNQKAEALSADVTNDALKAANSALQSKDASVQQSGLRIFKSLVEKNQLIDQAIDAMAIALKLDTLNIGNKVDFCENLLKNENTKHKAITKLTSLGEEDSSIGSIINFLKIVKHISFEIPEQEKQAQ